MELPKLDHAEYFLMCVCVYVCVCVSMFVCTCTCKRVVVSFIKNVLTLTASLVRLACIACDGFKPLMPARKSGLLDDPP